MGADPMTADIELLPLSEYLYGREASDNERVVTIADAHAYAFRNVAHHTAAKDAEIESLKAKVEKAERSVEHTHQWYAVRLEKIKEVAKRVGLWSEVATIIANGSSSIYDPPTYAQKLNMAKHETKAAEARAERLAEALHKLEDACDDSDGAQYGTLGTSFVRGICKNALLRDHDQEDKNDGQG